MINLIKSAIALLVLLILMCASAFATITGYTGYLDHNNTIVISGSSFGTKPTATPLRFDDFEDGTPGEKIIWELGSDCNKSEYSTSVTRGQGLQTSHHDFVNDGVGVKLCENETEFSTFYLDFWVYVAPVDNYSRNYKVWRMWRDNNLLQVYEQVYCSSHRDDAIVEVYDSDNGDNISNLSHGQQNNINNQWKHYQVELVQSTPSVADGRVNQWVNGADDALISESQITRVSTKTWTQFRLGSFWSTAADDPLLCPANGGANVYIDDAYLDTSLARVELIDNAVYDNSVHREIQLPTAWESDGTEITVTINQGSFADGATAWIAVTDSTGTQQGTYEITIGAASTAPVVNAGTDQAVSVNSASISGTYTLEGGRTVSSCTWSNDRGGSGTLTAAGGTITGTVTGLSSGVNVITITVTDSEAEEGSDSLNVTYTPVVSTVSTNSSNSAGCMIR